MNTYQVVTVDDNDLPTGHEWALVELADRTLFIVTESADPMVIRPDVWAAYRLLAQGRHAAHRVPLRAAG